MSPHCDETCVESMKYVDFGGEYLPRPRSCFIEKQVLVFEEVRILRQFDTKKLVCTQTTRAKSGIHKLSIHSIAFPVEKELDLLPAVIQFIEKYFPKSIKSLN